MIKNQEETDMKLTELKEKFKNRYAIRIVAGVLTVALLSGSVAGYNVYAAKDETAQTEIKTQENAEQELEEKITEQAGFLEGAESKEETVYILADHAGNAKTTIVSEWLKNPEKKDKLSDVSDLNEIENVKGDETSEEKEGVLSWDAGGRDIYYQGTTTKQAPVTAKITYYLDGKEKKAEEMAGKSGKVKIRFDYTNHEKKGDVCVPFVVLSGMVLKDGFSNIEVTNGKVISNGDANFVIGAAMPGLKESLDVDDSDFSGGISIPDYVEVTADAENFALGMTMTAVSGIPKLSEGETFDFSELDEKIDDLSDAAGQLRDGSGELSGGLDTLHQKMGEFSDGVDTLQSGVLAYTDGAQKLADGIGTLKGQTGILISGISDLVSNVGTLNEGVRALDQALNAPMGDKEKASVKAQAKAQAERAVDAQFADNTNPMSYQNIKAQASQAFYASVASDASKQKAAAAAKQAAAAGIQEQKAAICAQAKEAAAAGIQEQKAAICAQAKAQAEAAVNGRLDEIASEARDQAQASAQEAVSGEMKEQLKASFAAAGYVQAAKAQGISVEEAMENGAISAQVSQEAEVRLQALLGTVKTAAGDVADQTARSVASNITGSVAEQAAGSAAEQAAPEAAEQAAGSAAEQAAVSVAEQVAVWTVDSVAGQAKDTVGTSVADSVKQGAKTAAGQAAGQASVEGAEAAKKQVAKSIEKKDAKSGYSLVSGMEALNNGVRGISGKAPQLTKGIDQLFDGSQTLAAKNGELTDGTKKLSDGKDQLAEGVRKLKDGSEELKDGIVRFDEEGIEKLIDSYNGDVKELADRISAVLDAGKEYDSFGGKEKQTKGNVKFIIKTEEIKAEKESEKKKRSF